MIRVRTLFFTVLPSMVAGGFLFASAFGHAETGREVGLWPASSDTATGRVLVAQNDPWGTPRTPRTPRTPPTPPTPPSPPGYYGVPPVPPVPPVPAVPPVPTVRRHGNHGHGVSVSIHDGKVQIDGLADMIEGQLEGVSAMLDGLSDVPPDVRERVKERVRSVRRTVNNRLGKLKTMDVDKIGPEMERMGDEIEKDMEGLDKDLEKLGEKFGEKFSKRVQQQLGQQIAKTFSHTDSDSDSDSSDDGDDDDDDDRGAAVMPPGADVDPGDLAQGVADLKNLTLKPSQKAELQKVRADTDSRIRIAKQALDQASSRLHDLLGNPGAGDSEIASQIDAVSQQEAAIRKARILGWVHARNVLDKDQRKQVEAAARRGH